TRGGADRPARGGASPQTGGGGGGGRFAAAPRSPWDGGPPPRHSSSQSPARGAPERLAVVLAFAPVGDSWRRGRSWSLRHRHRLVIWRSAVLGAAWRLHQVDESVAVWVSEEDHRRGGPAGTDAVVLAGR